MGFIRAVLKKVSHLEQEPEPIQEPVIPVPPPKPEPVQESIPNLEPLRAFYRRALHDIESLENFICSTPEEANTLKVVLEPKLPKPLAVMIVRRVELNVYRLTNG